MHKLILIYVQNERLNISYIPQHNPEMAPFDILISRPKYSIIE